MIRTKLKTRLPQNDGLLIAPLLDIIFLVLIFFLMNINYKGVQSFDVIIPQASSPDNHQPSGRITVILDENRVLINNIETSLPTFKAVLKDEMKTSSSNSVLILGAEDIAYKKLVDIIDLVKESGATAINLGVEKK